MRSFDYAIDRADRLTLVTDAWLAFAGANEASQLTREAVLDEPIWRFIADASTRHLYELVFEQVRESRRRFRLPMRCDSPDRRRFMELDIRPLADGAILLRCLLLREEPRPPQPLLDPAAPRSDSTIEACGWCKRLRGADGRWREIEAAIVRDDLLGAKRLPQITHTVCADCEHRVRESLRSESGRPGGGRIA